MLFSEAQRVKSKTKEISKLIERIEKAKKSKKEIRKKV